MNVNNDPNQQQYRKSERDVIKIDFILNLASKAKLPKLFYCVG